MADAEDQSSVDNPGDWPEYQRLILHRLDQNLKNWHDVDARLRCIEIKLAIIKTKMLFASMAVALLASGAITLLVRRFG